MIQKIIKSILVTGLIVGTPPNITAKPRQTLENKLSSEEINQNIACINLSEIKKNLEYIFFQKDILRIYNNERVNFNFDKEYVLAVILEESGGNCYAESKKGARGLMQIMPETWRYIEPNRNFYEYAFNPQENIKVGVELIYRINIFCERNHVDWEQVERDQKLKIITAVYNAGPNRIKRNNWSLEKIPYETRNHIERVMKRYYLLKE